ncbi:MAG: DNA polymerase III subunit gamma/tau, partial [Pseudomonadota bacterium]
FILTGIRGTGKTTTARIIAKGLNCIGPDGTGGPTTEPCGVCENCLAIADDRHVDVFEMDAASRTGIDDIREIIDSVAYRATSARYKVYIIDEVHMLSRNAFNALLKTLEEPPEHVKFIFATTEIRKVPVTVLSRCQRFDLRRIEPDVMIAHLASIADKEGAKIAQDALALIARAAEGSVRDAMSLLDQAIAQRDTETTADDVRSMLGLADRGRVLDLFELIMRGDAAGALGELSAQYGEGADPLAVLRDLAEVTHWISVSQITPEAGDDPTVSPDERDRGQSLAKALPMRALARSWQMLLKSLDEVAQAPNAMMAAEMAVIRLTHVADLPTPEELVRKIKDAPPPAPPPGASPAKGNHAPVLTSASPSPQQPAPAPTGGPTAALALAPDTESALSRYQSFEQVVGLIKAQRDMQLLIAVQDHVRLVSYAPGRIEFEPTQNAPRDMAQRLGQRLQTWTGVRWGVSVVNEGGAPTISEVRHAREDAQKTAAMDDPLVKAVFDAFAHARIDAIKTPEDLAQEAAQDALAEVDEEWDPFEED